MDLEEMKCSLCGEQFNEKSKIPMLLPDCGHSYCLQCIAERVGDPTCSSPSKVNFNTGDDGAVEELLDSARS